MLGALSVYPSKKKECIEAKNRLQNKAKNFYKGREKNTEQFKNEIFPLNYDEEEEKRSRYKEEESSFRDNNGLIDYKKLNRLINLKKET